MYSSMMLTPEQIQSPATSNDKGYMNLTNAGPALDMGINQCMSAIFDRSKQEAEEAKKEAAARQNIVKAGPGVGFN